MIYEYLIELLALSVLENHSSKKKEIFQNKNSIKKLKETYNNLPEGFGGNRNDWRKMSKPTTRERQNTKVVHDFLGVPHTSKNTIDPNTGKELSAATFSAKSAAQEDLLRLDAVKQKVRDSGKMHEITFIGKKGPQLDPEKHVDVEHDMEVRMHESDAHVFHKGKIVHLRASGNGLQVVIPHWKTDKIIAHSGQLITNSGVIVGRKESREEKAAAVEAETKKKKVAKTASIRMKKRHLAKNLLKPAAKPPTPPPTAAPAGQSRLAHVMAFMRNKRT